MRNHVKGGSYLIPYEQLVIPKFHGAKLTDIPDEDLLEILVSEDDEKKNIGIDSSVWRRYRK